MFIEDLNAKVVYFFKEEQVSAAIYREGRLIIGINKRDSAIEIAIEVMEELEKWRLMEK